MLTNAQGYVLIVIIYFCRADALEHDLYTVPAASAELGLLYITTGRLEEAQKYLDGARCVSVRESTVSAVCMADCMKPRNAG